MKKSLSNEQQRAVNQLRAYVKAYMATGVSKETLVAIGQLARAVLEKRAPYSKFVEYVEANNLGSLDDHTDVSALSLAVTVGQVASQVK